MTSYDEASMGKRFWAVGIVALAFALAAQGLPAIAALLAPPAPDPLPTVVFIARADNPVDALAASSVAGQMGGAVLLSGSNVLDSAARAGLDRLQPDLVILAGGTSALSEQVRADIEAMGLTVRRVSGAGRTQTAEELSKLAEEFGFGRPLLTGAQVEGDAFLGGTLSVDRLRVANAETPVAAHEWKDLVDTDLDTTATVVSATFTAEDPCGGGQTRNRYLISVDGTVRPRSGADGLVFHQVTLDSDEFTGPIESSDPNNRGAGGHRLDQTTRQDVASLTRSLYVDDVEPGEHTARLLTLGDVNHRHLFTAMTVLHLGYECGGTPAWPTPGAGAASASIPPGGGLFD